MDLEDFDIFGDGDDVAVNGMHQPLLPANQLHPEFFNVLGGDVVEEGLASDVMTPDPNSQFTRNLALDLPESELDRIAQDLLTKIESDEKTREPWYQRFRRGLEMMGVHEDALDDGPFPGASSAVHPLLAEAMVQFWARAEPELIPPEGPVKVKVTGEQTEEATERAERVENYMNYQCLVEDYGFREESSRALIAVPWQGCAFTKTFYSPIRDTVCKEFVQAEHLIAPYSATSLEQAPRFTHRMFKTVNEVRKMQAARYYRPCDLAQPDYEEVIDAQEARDEAVDRGTPSGDPDDARHIIFEVSTEYEIPGHPDMDEDGNETGIALPYIVSIEKSSRKILSIYRNWREDDDLKQRRVYVTKYGYIPGWGLYDFGLFHLIGGLSEAATGALRLVLDGSATASMQGGYRTKQGKRLGEGRSVIEPGVWKDTDLSHEDISKAFYTPPFKEPSPSLFNLLGFLVESAQRFSSTTETMVGDADNNAPVGTTVALIEQGSKVFSAIHSRLHHSAAHEYRIRYELTQEFMPEGGYPYDVLGDEREVFKEDFGPGISLLPVSDPNIFSQTQRIAIAQSSYQLATENPDIIDRREAVERMLKALKTPDIDSLLIKDDDLQPMDPVSENQALLLGKPAKVFAEQDHEAHIQVHIAFLEHPQFGGHPEAQEAIFAAAKAHLAEHMAALYVQRMNELGVPAQFISRDDEERQTQALPPHVAEQIGMEAARVSGEFLQTKGVPHPEPEQPAPDANHQVKMMQGQQKMQQDDQRHQMNLQHSDEAHKQNLEQERQAHQQRLGQMISDYVAKDRQDRTAADADAMRGLLQEIQRGGASLQ